jgi:RNA polymerase sigma factor for flagellar operon FliA
LAQAGVRIHFSAMEAEAGDGSGEGRKWDVCDPHAQDPSGPMARQLIADYITRGLSRDERMILVLYYYENLTMAEIGSLLNLSESRVSQIHKDVLQRLRTRAGSRQLAEELAG